METIKRYLLKKIVINRHNIILERVQLIKAAITTK